MAQLPLYYKNSKPTAPISTTKRWKEYYLLVITIVGFVILIAGVLWFVPGMEEDRSYDRAYDSFTGSDAVEVEHMKPIHPTRPGPGGKDSDINSQDILKRDTNFGHDLDPRQRKLEEEVVPVPGRGRPNNIEGGQYLSREDEAPREKDEVQNDMSDDQRTAAVSKELVSDNAQIESNHRPAVVEDEETREKREKVIEVSD